MRTNRHTLGAFARLILARPKRRGLTPTFKPCPEGPGRRFPTGPRTAPDLTEEAAEDEREDPAVAQVLALTRSVETQSGAKRLPVGAHDHLPRLPVL